ncbi:MAG: phospholipase D-like domain-containing protein [Caldilinea sp.]
MLLIHDFKDKLECLAKSSIEIKVLIAFLTEEGLSWLPEDKVPCADFIVGIDLGITSPQALQSLQKQGASVRVFSEPGRMFHPKAIFLRSESDQFLIIGSNNLTDGGISSNHELSILSTRNSSNDADFDSFLAYFDSLKVHDCCRVPDSQFYDSYKPTDIRKKLADHIKQQKGLPPPPPPPGPGDPPISTLGDFIRLLAKEFPNVPRKRGSIIKNHPLKRRNDVEFRPLFKDIVAKASQNRLTGYSDLHRGGKWHLIPLITASDNAREPWSKSGTTGCLALQIHYSDDFSEVYFSIVLQYGLPRSKNAAAMPVPVAERFRKLREHVEHFSAQAVLDRPVFLYFTYEDTIFWSKPLMTFVYALDSLPDDKVLCSTLERLAMVLNGAMAI